MEIMAFPQLYPDEFSSLLEKIYVLTYSLIQKSFHVETFSSWLNSDNPDKYEIIFAGKSYQECKELLEILKVDTIEKIPKKFINKKITEIFSDFKKNINFKIFKK